jgi:hypothetical protein
MVAGGASTRRAGGEMTHGEKMAGKKGGGEAAGAKTLGGGVALSARIAGEEWRDGAAEEGEGRGGWVGAGLTCGLVGPGVA